MFMENVFFVLFLLSVVGLIVSLIKVPLLSRLLKKDATRKSYAIFFGVVALIFFVLAKDTQENIATKKQEQKVEHKRKIVRIPPVNYEIVESKEKEAKIQKYFSSIDTVLYKG